MQINRYKIIKSLQQTSKWELFLAKNQDTDFYVKIRVFNQTLTANEKIRDKLIESLNHFILMKNKYFITILEYGYLDKNTIYAVLEHLDYLDLRNIINIAQRIPQDVASIILQEILKGLVQAQLRGLYHGYLSPYSIVTSTSGVVKIQDISFSSHDQYFHNFICSESIHNNLYYAPEHILRKPLDHRTDLFLTGVIVYEMITGKHPFYKPDKPWDSHRILSENPEPIFAYAPYINPILEKVIEKLMQKSPDKRYENAASALQDLEPYLKSLPDYKPYEILSAYFANPKDSTIKIESKYYNSLYEEARANYYYRNYNKALFQMQIIKSQNYNFEGLNVYIDNIREKKGFLPINESVVKAIDDCKSRLECEPNNIEILLKLAELNLKIGNYYESVYYAKKALQEDENNQTALKIVRSFIRLDDAEVESIRATSGAIVQSADHKKEQQKLTMSIYKKLFVIIVFLGIVIWIMSYFGMINFHTFVKEVSAYDFNAKYDKIAPEALAEIMHKIENSKQEVDKKEAIKKLLYYADLNLEPMESCNVAAMLCNAYISVGNYSLAKESLRRLRRVCPDFALAKGPYKLYAEKMEQAGKYYEAMNAYIEMLLYLKRSDPDYDIIEKKVRELQKIMIGGISMKPEENINR